MVVIGSGDPSGTMRPVKSAAVLMEEYPVKDFKLTQTAMNVLLVFNCNNKN
jgi:hypothetical protein